jgi:cyclopropane-fatty-acyl-phospholipid synthase
LGLSDRVDVQLKDYREVTGQFDAVVSIEMIEAVGEEFWPAYLQAIDRLLTPDGTAVVQAILMDHHRYLATRNSYGWIQKHIFPGGLLPSLEALEEVATRHTGLRVRRIHPFGAHYAHTLRRWRRTFDANWPQIASHGFDEVFRRQWEFYLAYCEAGFATGYLDVAQLTFRRG